MGKSSLVSLLAVVCSAILGWFAYGGWGAAGLAAVFAIVPSLVTAAYAAKRGAKNCSMPPLALCGSGINRLIAYLALLSLAAFWSMQADLPRAEATLFQHVIPLPGVREWIAGSVLVIVSVTISTRHLRRIRSARS
jgi:hypothetical protein